MVTLGAVADVGMRSGYGRIFRENNERRIAVKLSVGDRDLGSLVAEAQRNAAAVKMPTGYRAEWTGSFENQQRAQARLMIVVPHDKIEPQHLPPELFRATSRMAQQPNATLHEARSAYEREFILRKLEENQWHMTRTAEALGLERSHLYRRMRTLGIKTEE